MKQIDEILELAKVFEPVSAVTTSDKIKPAVEFSLVLQDGKWTAKPTRISGSDMRIGPGKAFSSPMLGGNGQSPSIRGGPLTSPPQRPRSPGPSTCIAGIQQTSAIAPAKSMKPSLHGGARNCDR